MESTQNECNLICNLGTAINIFCYYGSAYKSYLLMWKIWKDSYKLAKENAPQWFKVLSHTKVKYY